MNILVTGGAGYIGSHFINLLLESTDHKAIVVDILRQGGNNKINNDRVKYIETDLVDREALAQVFKDDKIDLVVHFAALASVPDSVSQPSEYYRNNLIGGLNLIDCMKEYGVGKIIFSSSASVYGEPAMEEIKEDHPKQPTNPYGRSKLIFEQILSDYHKAYGLDSVSFRYFCAAGCDESGRIGEYHQPETHVIPCLLETVLGKRQMFYVYGNDFPTPDGTGIRDYIHVNDLAAAHVAAIGKLLAGNCCSAYNLGINKGYSVMELIAAAEKVSGQKVPYEIKERRPGDPSRLIADASMAQSELGWQPEYTDIEEIIRTAYDFFKIKNI